MGAPTSSILSEIYLQHLENTPIFNILRNSGIEGYFRYVDDILLIYYENRTDIGEIVHFFNELTPNLNFTLEQEVDNKLHFLDISIMKIAGRISFDIYRNPTTSDIIPNGSRHPQEQKMAAIRYFLNRINAYDIDVKRNQVELDTIKQIIHNNRYEISTLDNVKRSKKPKHKHDNQNEKWAKFTYVGRETRHITTLFKNTQK